MRPRIDPRRNEIQDPRLPTGVHNPGRLAGLPGKKILAGGSQRLQHRGRCRQLQVLDPQTLQVNLPKVIGAGAGDQCLPAATWRAIFPPKPVNPPTSERLEGVVLTLCNSDKLLPLRSKIRALSD